MKTEKEITQSKTQTGNMQAAIDCYYKRLVRDEHPEGEFDNASRWYPNEEEKCDCCYGLRVTSRSYPYSLMVHCRTINHIANLFQVDMTQMKKHIRNFNKLKLEVEKENSSGPSVLS